MKTNPQLREFARPERLRMGRLLRAKTQSELANDTGIDQSLISKYENGRELPAEHLTIIANILELPEEFFFRPITIQALDGADMAMFRRQQSTTVKTKIKF